MFSEVDYLCRQLEYCIMMKKARTAKEIVKILIQHKANLRITIENNYECACHEYFNPNFTFINSEKTYFEFFEPCRHYICRDCLEKYIRVLFETAGVDFIYFCPGCAYLDTEEKSELDPSKPYFTSIVPNYEELKTVYKIKDEELLKRKIESKNICMNEINHCPIDRLEEDRNPDLYKLYGFPQDYKGSLDYNSSDLEIIPGCNHTYCKKCLKSIFYYIVTNGKPRICPFRGCNFSISENFISKFFNYRENDDFAVLIKLKLSDFFYVKCKKCLFICKLSKADKRQTCENQNCKQELCSSCGDYYHIELYCTESKKRKKYERTVDEDDDRIDDVSNEENNNNEENFEELNQEEGNIVKFKKKNYYREYECSKNSLIPILKQAYYHGFTLFHWEIREDIFHMLYQLDQSIPKYEFKVKKVVFIKNEELELDYIKAKKELEEKLNRNITEMYVFHGSKEENYDSICREGLKMGGRDVQKSFGSRHGLGIYTAKDPITSTFYSKTNKLLVCKVLLGRKTNLELAESDDLNKFEHDYKEIPNDAFQQGSTYFIFFRKEHLVPTYLIEFT